MTLTITIKNAIQKVDLFDNISDLLNKKTKFYIIFVLQFKDNSQNEGVKNRFTNSASIHQIKSNLRNRLKLNFLSYGNEGGRDVVTKTCRKIATKIKSEQLQLSDLTQDLVDTQILGTKNRA